MSDNHPTPEELEGLFLGGLSAGRTRDLILHLLQGCDACTQALSPHLPFWFLPEAQEASPSSRPEDYDAPIDRTFALFQTWIQPGRTAQEIKREALQLLAEGGLPALADASPLLSGLLLFETLLERSWALRHGDPAQMIQLAQAAALQALHFKEVEVGLKKAADLRCQAWTELANAYRVADQLDQAEEALVIALGFFHRGTLGDLLGARYFDVYASQQVARRRFDMAVETLDMVATVYRRHGEHHLAGRALIMRGISSGYLGKAEEAIRSFRRGLAGIDQERDPGLVLSAIQSEAWCLVDCGRYVEAQVALLDLQRRGLNPGGRLGVLKLRWLEGHVHAGLNELKLAEQALREVKQGFEEAGLVYKAALAGLELGSVWLQQGAFSEAEEIVLECADVFLSLRIRRELVASLLVVRQAAASRYLSLNSLQKLIAELHKEERSPRATPPE